jgi:hypothetical protein
MVLISFQHSIKYIYAQLAPYLLLTAAAAYAAFSFGAPWFLVYLAMGLLTGWRFIELCSTSYLFTHDMLIVSRGIMIRQIDCRALWQLKGTEVRTNRLLRILHVSHIFCGLEGPPADRIRITGVDNTTMLKVLNQLTEGIKLNTEMWREHFQGQVA